VPSGELILEDATTKPQRATIMSWQRAGRAKHTNAIKMAGNGQRHVIPLADAGSIVVDFGNHALFYFRWRQLLTPSAVAALRQGLAAIGWKSFVASLGKDMASGDYETLKKLAHKPRCAKASDVPRERAGRGVVGRLHSYGELGVGSTSITSAAVDVESGRLWAVKKVIDRKGRPGWKKGFRREVEQLQKLKHVSRPSPTGLY
jgi:hypothetical protein